VTGIVTRICYGKDTWPVYAVAFTSDSELYAVSNVVDCLKGKGAIQIACKSGGRQKNFTDEHCWARGYFVSCGDIDLCIIPFEFFSSACKALTYL
jgi:hypothetical protein